MRFFSAMDSVSYDYFLACKATGTPIRVIPIRVADVVVSTWHQHSDDLTRPVPVSHYLNIVCGRGEDCARLYTLGVPNVAIIQAAERADALKDYDIVISPDLTVVSELKEHGIAAQHVGPDARQLAPLLRALL